MKVYTIGHSTATIEDFIARLRDNAIDVLVDVRSKPRSRLYQFDQRWLQTAVEEAGLRYRFLGDRLGGVPRDPQIAVRWRQGHLDPIIVGHLRTTEEWHDGLDELVKLVASRGGEANVCIMCSEGDPNECHRKAVALDVAELLGAEIIHLSIHKTAPGEVGVQEVLL